MKDTNIFIARHGETEFNRTNRIQGRGIDEPLNATGQAQARAIAGELRDNKVDHIFSSSLKRSKETAKIIGAELNMNVESFSELDEMDFGNIEGRPISEIRENLDELHQRWKGGDTAFAVEQGESPGGVLKRVLKRTDILLAEHPGQTLLFVLHGRLIRILLAHWLGYGLPQMHRIEHQNGALYHLRFSDKNGIEAVFMNGTQHLEIVGAERGEEF